MLRAGDRDGGLRLPRTVNLAGGPEATLILPFPAAHLFSELVDRETVQSEEGSLAISHTS